MAFSFLWKIGSFFWVKMVFYPIYLGILGGFSQILMNFVYVESYQVCEQRIRCRFVYILSVKIELIPSVICCLGEMHVCFYEFSG